MCAIRERLLPVLGPLLLLAACDRSPYPGFTPVGNGLYWRLHALGEGERSPAVGDSIRLRARVALHGAAPGSFYSTEHWFAVKDAGAFRASVIDRMVEGDSVSMIAQASVIPWSWLCPALVKPPMDPAIVDLELRIMQVMTPVEASAAAEERRMAAHDAYEEGLLAAFRDSNGWEAWNDDLFYRIEKAPSGRAVVASGELVSIHYQGSFLDGRIFDDTRTAGEPLTFRLGDPGQVVKGIETALHLLVNGGSGEFVMRSNMAFGARGSAGGVVPPFTPVRFHVEVVAVSDRPAG